MSVPGAAGHTPTGQYLKKKDKKTYPAPFIKYNFYLDVKPSKVKNNLIDDITALGGNLAEFLTKEVTHVISEGPEWKFLVLSTSSKCGPPSPWTPGASPSPATSTSLDGEQRRLKVRSRVESILNTAKVDSFPGGDVLETAKKLQCQIWALNKTLAWLEKFKAKFGKSTGSGSRQSVLANGGSVSISGNSHPKPHSHHQQQQQHHTPQQQQLPHHQNLAEPFIKLDSTLRAARPSFSELKGWPKINLDGYAGTSPFSEQKKSLAQKRLARVDSLKKKEEGRKRECAKKKVSGFCEICNVNFSEIERHLRGESHTKFVKDSSNWRDLDVSTESHNTLHQSHSILVVLKDILLKE